MTAPTADLYELPEPKDDRPEPPGSALLLALALHRYGWTVKLWQTHGAGTHPSRGYVKAEFCEVWGTKDGIRIDANWIIEQRPLGPGWKSGDTVGRWAMDRGPLLSRIVVGASADKFARLYAPWSKNHAGGPYAELVGSCSLKYAMESLVPAPSPSAVLAEEVGA